MRTEEKQGGEEDYKEQNDEEANSSNLKVLKREKSGCYKSYRKYIYVSRLNCWRVVKAVLENRMTLSKSTLLTLAQHKSPPGTNELLQKTVSIFTVLTEAAPFCPRVLEWLKCHLVFPFFSPLPLFASLFPALTLSLSLSLSNVAIWGLTHVSLILSHGASRLRTTVMYRVA